MARGVGMRDRSPNTSTIARGLNELRCEIPDLRKSLLNLQTAGQADVDIRLNDRKLRRRQTVLEFVLVLEVVDVSQTLPFGLKLPPRISTELVISVGG